MLPIYVSSNRCVNNGFFIVIFFFLFVRFVVNSFDHEASRAKLDLTADSEETLKQQRRLKHWDRKKKKMVACDTVSNENIANLMYIK
jgi:hypothetical protein